MIYVKEIPKKAKYDFVVCGGGMTGFAAAVSAARKGLKTAIVEKKWMPWRSSYQWGG